MTVNYGFRTPEQLVVGYWIWVITVPMLLAVGTVGNVISILVLCRKKMRKNASSVYLVNLAILDLMVLYLDALKNWLYQILERDFLSYAGFVCKILVVQTPFLRDISAWILVAITSERVIATTLPSRYKAICSRKLAGIAISTILTLALLINGHVLVAYGVSDIDTGNGTTVKVCGPVMDYEEFLGIWPVIHLVKGCLLPVLIMVPGSICILATLFKQRNRSVLPIQSAANSGTRRTFTAMSRLLLGLNAVFVCTTIPVFVYQGIDPYLLLLDIPMYIKMRDPTVAALMVLNYLNHVLNFILYCFTGSVFRAELWAMLSSLKNRVLSVLRRTDTVVEIALGPV